MPPIPSWYTHPVYMPPVHPFVGGPSSVLPCVHPVRASVTRTECVGCALLASPLKVEGSLSQPLRKERNLRKEGERGGFKPVLGLFDRVLASFDRFIRPK